MPLYSPSQIYGKTLYAAKPVAIKRLPEDAAPTVYTVAPGNIVGVVYSSINPGPLRKQTYWMYYDQQNRPYYTEHEQGRYSLALLKEQGAKSDVEIQKEEKEKLEKASETFGDVIQKYANYILYGAAAYLGIKLFLENRKK